jgi:hypothetical protein
MKRMLSFLSLTSRYSSSEYFERHHIKFSYRYFTSRPDIFANADSSAATGATPERAAATAVHRALASNPEATSKLVSTGLKHGVPKSSPYAAAVSVPVLRIWIHCGPTVATLYL